MENAPAIILFWTFGIVLFVLTIALLIAAVILIKKGKDENDEKMQFFGKLCLALSMIGSVPVLLTVGYILYLRIT